MPVVCINVALCSKTPPCQHSTVACNPTPKRPPRNTTCKLPTPDSRLHGLLRRSLDDILSGVRISPNLIGNTCVYTNHVYTHTRAHTHTHTHTHTYLPTLFSPTEKKGRHAQRCWHRFKKNCKACTAVLYQTDKPTPTITTNTGSHS